MTDLGGCGGVLRPRPRPPRAGALLLAPSPEFVSLGLRTPQTDWWRQGAVEAVRRAFARSPIGTTYLCCFHTERCSGGRMVRRRATYEHAAHSVGHARDLDRRERQHRAGTASHGARLLEVILAAGLDFTIARVWPGTSEHWEAQLKRWRI